MEPVGLVFLTLGIWCGYCAARSFNPYTMLVAVLKDPGHAGGTLHAGVLEVENSWANSGGKSDATSNASQGGTLGNITIPNGLHLGSFTTGSQPATTSSTTNYGTFQKYTISCGFTCHENRNSGAPGVDFEMPVGTKLYTPYAGVVSFTPNSDPASGNTITVRLSNGDLLHMRHVEGVNSSVVGKSVPAGTLVGYSGGAPGMQGAGDSTGPHTHVDLSSAGKYIPFYTLLAPLFSGSSQEA